MDLLNTPYLFEAVAILIICFSTLFVIKDFAIYRSKFRLIESKLANLSRNSIHLSTTTRNTRVIDW